MVGSTLDGGPDWADDANGVLVACGVDRGAVIAVMDAEQVSQCQCSAQPMSCTCPQAWQVFDDGNQRSATTVATHTSLSCRTGAGARCAQGRIRQSTPTTRAPGRPFCRSIPTASKPSTNDDPAVSFSQVWS